MFFYFHPYLGKSSNLTNIVQMGWNHQPGFFNDCLVTSFHWIQAKEVQNESGQPHMCLAGWALLMAQGGGSLVFGGQGGTDP